MMTLRARILLPLTAIIPFLSAQPASSEPIAFAHKNWSDLRGILNVFDAFKQACLAQPVTKELPQELRPEGYQVVSSSLHGLGFDSNAEPKAVVLSVTGDEVKDFEQGEPFLRLGFPTDDAPNGQCSAGWKRAWDYDEGVQGVMTAAAAVFDSWMSFHLKAVRVSRPEDGFAASKVYSSVSEWAVPCFDGTWCRVSVLLDLRLDEGIHLTMQRGDPPTAPGGG
ncbi:MAG: hypothetical protein JJ864_13045 [Rhizobiaceae bacterium]|nr:hypothetical protein [Rhizobiaceae bacterium]